MLVTLQQQQTRESTECSQTVAPLNGENKTIRSWFDSI